MLSVVRFLQLLYNPSGFVKILPVASRTTLKYLAPLNFVLSLPIESLLQFIRGFILRPPFHVEDLFNRPQEPLRRSMTLQTPLHLQGFCLVENRHIVDSTVTGRTADALFHVNAVIEIGVIRKIVNANPFDWPARAEAGANWFEIRTVSPDLLVATHARVS